MNKRSKEIAIKAILARFGGDRNLAWRYCLEMMEYPALRDEYNSYAGEILQLELGANA